MTIYRQSYRFVIVGILATIINYIINAMVLNCGSGPEVASATGYVLGLSIGFPLNKYWSFESSATHGTTAEITRYFMLYILTLLINLLLASASYRLFDRLGDTTQHAYLKNIYYLPVIAITTVLNFLGCRLLVFKKGPTI